MDEAFRDNLCSILAELGVRDQRVYAELCDAFERDERSEPDWESPFGLIGLADLVDAHERLGAPLPDGLRAHVDELHEKWDALAARRQATEARVKVGRNDPCPCGSGKKYKKCCLANA